jgi:hypothetical protein
VVAANGTLSRNSGATGVTKLGTGQYRVEFNQDVNTCAWIVQFGTIGATTPSPLPSGFSETQLSGTGNNRVIVYTVSSSIALADRNFHLAVFC